VKESLQQSVADPTYLDFFGLTQPPFGRISDPTHLFQTEQYSLLMGHLVHATRNTDSLVAICGADGSGKSTLIERYVSGLDDQIYCVKIDESCQNESQFYGAFLTQIGFNNITGTAGELKNITKEFLVCRGIANDHVLLIIDNAHLTAPIILEQLRWISEIAIKDRRVLSVVLTGNADLVHVIKAPTVSQIKFDSSVIFNIRKFSAEETASYVWHGLRLVGGSDAAKLTNEAISLIHRYSGGIPQQINRLCNDLLAEAYRLETRVIGGKVVRIVADRQGLLPHVTPLHGKGRRRTDPDFEHLKAVPKVVETITSGAAQTSNSVGDSMPTKMTLGSDDLLKHLSQLAERLEDLRADKMRALRDIDVRNHDIVELRAKLDAQTREVESLRRSAAINAEEITRQNLQLSRNAAALQVSENQSKKLNASLEQEIRAREAAEDKLAIATAAVENLGHSKIELQATVDDRNAEQLDIENDDLKKKNADLKGVLEARTRELGSLQNELTLRNQTRIDLQRETSARKIVENNLARAMATIKDLQRSKHELQATINDLKAGQEARLAADEERIIEIQALAKTTADLRVEVESKTRDLDSLRDELTSRDEVLAGLEAQLDASKKEHASDSRRPLATRVDKAPTAEEVATASSHDARIYTSQVVAKFEQSIESVHAYQTLRRYDPAFYDDLITTYKRLVGQDLTEKQVNDALRAKQAKLIERLLPRAADDAIITYARLMIDQLEEFQVNGTEPCLTLLLPQSNPDDCTPPIYSESTKGRELDTLDITLRTYRADKPLPTEPDVWPDLGPIFAELFEEFGADNVAKLQNSYDPNVDRALVCNVSKALYSGILTLPKRKAANTLRWLLSD
jgi:type II secretory pathway predicted ATPase ExeA